MRELIIAVKRGSVVEYAADGACVSFTISKEGAHTWPAHQWETARAWAESIGGFVQPKKGKQKTPLPLPPRRKEMTDEHRQSIRTSARERPVGKAGRSRGKKAEWMKDPSLLPKHPPGKKPEPKEY